jgi:5-methylcytosine-specific restriction enzyme B
MGYIELDKLREDENNLLSKFAESCQFIGQRFRNWKASNFRRSNVATIARAVFDPEWRQILLEKGLNAVQPAINAFTQSVYSLEECANETGVPVVTLQRWMRAIERKKQVVLYGPPGTGKTYLAQKLSALLTSATQDGFEEIIQFHPAYTYEDFIQGIRPKTTESGNLEYAMTRGRFLEFCDRARETDAPCVLIIDEINRANLARVFGELMYLLEYRNETIKLASGEEFQIPDNVRIIGTMNTADRSIALVDHALRRRFAFLELAPDMNVLRQYQARFNCNVEKLIQKLQEINRAINNPHYALGISFFLQEELFDHIEDIWNMEIEPYLGEYFFDQPETAQKFSWERVSEDLRV